MAQKMLKNAKNGLKMCPTDQSIQRLSIITLAFICQSIKQTYISSKYGQFTTQQWILKLKSVNYDLNTVCPKKM